MNIEGKTFVPLEYKNYYIDNFSEHGCAIFDEKYTNSTNFLNLQTFIKKGNSAFTNTMTFNLYVFDKAKEVLHTYKMLINCCQISPYGFFDGLRILCNRFNIDGFYACNFEDDVIYRVTPASMREFGTLRDFKKIIDLNEDKVLLGRFIKWAGIMGYSSFYAKAMVFRNRADEEYNKRYPDCWKTTTYYSLEECKDKLDVATNTLRFKDDTILDFDIDDPTLSIKATRLKGRNLRLKNLTATEEVFCHRLCCEKIKANEVIADGIDCEKISAKSIRTSFEYGQKFVKNSKNLVL